MARRGSGSEAESLDGQRELLRAGLRDDAIDVVAARPLLEDVPAHVAWGMLLADLFHHVLDATVEFSGLDRLRASAGLREALVSITRSPNVGEVRWCAPSETLPPLPDALELVVVRSLLAGRMEMKLDGLGWGEGQYRQWAELIYDLIHAAVELEALAPELLKEQVLAEIDRPTTTFRGPRSRVSNIMPRGDRACWVSIPRVRGGLAEFCRLDLSLLTRAPVDGLGLSVRFTVKFEPRGKTMLPSAEEARLLDDLVSVTLAEFTSGDLVIASRTTLNGELSFLFYVRDQATADQLAKGLPSFRAEQVDDPSWSRFLLQRPDREELRRLANWDWLDILMDDGFDVDGAATVQHAFWVAGAEARDRLVERLTGDGFALTGTSESAEAGRTELIFERRLDELAPAIDDVTTELEARALEAGATYDGWDVARPLEGR